MKNPVLFLSVLLLAACLVIAILFARLERANLTVEQQRSIISEKNDTIKHYRNDRGRLVAEKLAAEASAKEIAAAYPALAQELKEEFDIKMKDLKAYVKNSFAAHGSGEGTVIHNHYVDSAGRKYPVWEMKASDQYIDFRASIVDTARFSYHYSYHDTITVAIATKKPWLFGKEKLYASASLRNPNATVTESTNILIKDYRDKRWCLYVGPGYDFINNQLSLNVGVGYTILKF